MNQHVAINREMPKMKATSNKKYGDVKAVAGRYDCHPSTVWRMVKRGQLPGPVKIGNLTRWEIRELLFLQERHPRHSNLLLGD